MLWVAFDASFSNKELDVGLEANLGTPTRLPKLVENALLLHELALSARTFAVEEAQRLLGLVSRVVHGLKAEILG